MKTSSDSNSTNAPHIESGEGNDNSSLVDNDPNFVDNNSSTALENSRSNSIESPTINNNINKKNQSPEETICCEKNKNTQKIKSSIKSLILFMKQLKFVEMEIDCNFCINFEFLSEENSEKALKLSENFQEELGLTNVFEIASFYSQAMLCLMTHRPPTYDGQSTLFQDLLKFELYLLSHLNFSSNTNLHMCQRAGTTHDVNYILNCRGYTGQKIRHKHLKNRLQAIGAKYRIDRRVHIHCEQALESVMYRIMRFNCRENKDWIHKLQYKEVNAMFFILFSRKEHFRFQRLYGLRKNTVGLRLNLILSLEGNCERKTAEILDDVEKKSFTAESESMMQSLAQKHLETEFIYNDVGIVYSNGIVSEVAPLMFWFQNKQKRVTWITLINKWREFRSFPTDVSMIQSCIECGHFREGIVIFESLEVFDKLLDKNRDDEFDMELIKKSIIYSVDCAVGGFFSLSSKSNTSNTNTSNINTSNTNNNTDINLEKNMKLKENFFFKFICKILKKINEPKIKKALNLICKKNVENIYCASISKIFSQFENLDLKALDLNILDLLVKESSLCITSYGFGSKDSVVNTFIKKLLYTYQTIDKFVQNTNIQGDTYNTACIKNNLVELIEKHAMKAYNVWKIQKEANKGISEIFFRKKNSPESEEIYENILFLQCNACCENRADNQQQISDICKDIKSSKISVDSTIIDILEKYHNNVIKCQCGLFSFIGDVGFEKKALDHFCRL